MRVATLEDAWGALGWWSSSLLTLGYNFIAAGPVVVGRNFTKTSPSSFERFKLWGSLPQLDCQMFSAPSWVSSMERQLYIAYRSFSAMISSLE